GGVKEELDSPIYPCNKKSTANWDNVISPWDFETMTYDYGMIYIACHGSSFALTAMPCIENDIRDTTERWFDYYTLKYSSNKGLWFYWIKDYNDFSWIHPRGESVGGFVKTIVFTSKYFKEPYTMDGVTRDFSNKFIIVSACSSYEFQDNTKAFGTPLAYIGFGPNVHAGWSYPFAYTILSYMMYGPENPIFVPGFDSSVKPPDLPPRPLDVRDALTILDFHYNVNEDPDEPGTKAHLIPEYPPDDVFLPAGLEIILEKD
ncbi:MAG: hypothetical protein KKA19_04280, partial [Candidatus Margulisbacteria bacterium]|nr:hypothetical protein [Candidatus Margulisiibacteriota bacterium]